MLGTAKKLLGVFDSRLWGSRAKYQFYSTGVWLVEASPDWGSGSSSPARKQTGAGFFAEHDLPTELAPGHLRQVPMAFKLARGDLPVPYFDPTT